MAHELSITVERNGKHFLESSVEPGKVLEGPFATEAEAQRNASRRSQFPNIRVDQSIANPLLPRRAPRPAITMAEQVSAAFGLENTLISTLNRLDEPTFEPTEGFDPRDHLRPGEEPVATRFVDANSIGEMNQIRTRITNEAELRRQLADGPLNEFFAALLAIIPDPTTFFGPGAAMLRGATTAGRVAKIGAASMLDITVSEGILQATQESRTAAESIGAIVLGGAFGFGLGGAIVGATAARTRAYKDAIKDFAALAEGSDPESLGGKVFSAGDEVGDFTIGGLEARVEGEGGSVGAARVEEEAFKAENTQLVSTFGVAKALGKLRGVIAPSVELMVSPFPKARELVMRLVDTGLTTKGQAKGLAGPPSVDLRIRRYTSVTAAGARFLKQTYRDFKRTGGTMNRREFYQEVGRAMRRGDQHTSPEVAQAAKSLRENVFEPLKSEAITMKLLDEDVKVETALSYFTRVYDVEKVIANRGRFRRILVDWLRAENPKADFQETVDVADTVIDRILGVPQSRLPTGIKIPQGKRGALKERTLDIPDEYVTSRNEAFEDFLVDDALEVMARYVRTLGADIEIVRAFGPVDPKTGIGQLFELQLGKLRDEARKIIDTAPAAKRAGLEKQLIREEKLLESLMDKVRGVLARPRDPRMNGMVRFAKGARNLNFLSKLGSVMLSSIPDVGLIVMQEGLARTFGTLFSEMATGFKGIRMARLEAQKAGTATEMEMSSRLTAVFDLGDKYAAETKFERGLDVAGTFFGHITLLNPWNEAAKSLTSALASSRILDVSSRLASGQKVSARDVTKLARANISQPMARRIAAQSEHFQRNGTVTNANTDAWTDAGAVEAFRDALLRDVDNTIITPGSGDAPLWTTTEWGKSIFQFKRFAAASTQRVLLSGLQARDMQTFNGLMVILALGAMGTGFRDLSKTGEVRDRNARQWIAEAIDRSGAVALFVEMDAIAGEATGLSLQRTLAGGQDVTRLQGRELIERLGGPTASLLSDLAAATKGALTRDFTQGDLHRLRRLLPAQNVFTFTALLDQIEKKLGEDLPSKQGRARRAPRVLPIQ